MARYLRMGILIFLSILLLLPVVGCWSRKELNQLSIVLALGIDQAGEEYEVSVQFIDPSSMTRNRSSNRSPSSVFSERGTTIFEALRKITTKASRRMYVAHIRFIVFDEQTARKGIRESLDFLFRDHEVRPDFYMAVAKNCKAKDIIGFVSKSEVLPGMDMFKSLKTSEKVWSPTSAMNVKELMIKFSEDGVDPVLTGLSLIGNIERGKTADNAKNPISYGEFKYEGIGVFKEDRLVGWLDENDSRAFSYITNRISSSVGPVKCPGSDKWISIELTDSKVKVIPKIKDHKPVIRLNVKVESNISEVQCNLDISDPKEFKKLEESTKESLERILKNGINTVKNYGADIYGFGEAFHRRYPKQWHAWKDHWDEQFKDNLTCELEIEYQLNRTGKTINPFTEKIKEGR